MFNSFCFVNKSFKGNAVSNPVAPVLKTFVLLKTRYNKLLKINTPSLTSQVSEILQPTSIQYFCVSLLLKYFLRFSSTTSRTAEYYHRSILIRQELLSLCHQLGTIFHMAAHVVERPRSKLLLLQLIFSSYIENYGARLVDDGFYLVRCAEGCHGGFVSDFLAE